MISFELKNSPEATSFHNLKQCIAEYYGEDPESYSKEFRELEELRGLACRPRTDMECCTTMKRYYSQLHSLQNRFPLSSDTELLNFAWKDIYSNSVWHTGNIRYEMASILYNIAVMHSKLGVEEERTDPESMKLACTHFQCAAWAFGEVKNQYGMLLKNDLAAELMIYMQQICFAQAQECILEKSLADNRKAAIIAKVAAQVISFYNAAMSALFSQNEDGTIQDLVGNKLYKEWLKYIKFKTSYLSSILFLYQGQNSEEQRKMGERVALYNAACDRLEEARKEMKGMHRAEAIAETLSLATDIIEGKRKNAKQENEFIYHEAIPDVSTISAVQGANLVQGISFDVTDSQVIGEDIFKRLVPMKTHENLSLYSEEKANILRQLGAKIDERDAELVSFMGSLNSDLLNSMKHSQGKLPQNLVDRCAELSGKPNAISDLVESMSNLANICTEVEVSLSEIKKILDEENQQEQNFQKQMGRRPTGHITELAREFTKYSDAHSKAGESNDTLRKAMELHVSNLKILSQPLSVLKDQVPQSECVDEEVRRELENLLNKVEQMKTQRDNLYEELRDQILNKDDITAQLVANGDKDVEELFKKELKKYSQSVSIIEQNLVAQGNILKALMDTYAKHAMKLKAFNDAKSRREQFYAGLIGSYDVYEDLISKSAKGVDFYKKLHANIQKLMSRVKAARDVQEEERQQLLKNAMAKAQQIEIANKMEIQKPSIPSVNVPSYSSASNMMHTHQSSSGGTSGMKLKDYIKSGMVPNIGNLRDETKIPAVRPSPVGQETIPHSNPASCSNVNYPSQQLSSASAYASQYYQQQQQQQHHQQQQQQAMIYQSQQYFTPQQQTHHDTNPVATSVENKYAVSNANSMSNRYNSSIYGQASTAVPQTGNANSSGGYVNPIYNNLNYQDKNVYSQTNYSATNPYYQQSSQTPISYNNQTPQISSVNSMQQPTHQTQTPSIQQNVAAPAYVLPQHQQQQPHSINSSPVVPPPSSYQNVQPSGDFIQNIYKSQLQYPTVQSPTIQQYPTTSTPLIGTNQYGYNQNSQYSGNLSISSSGAAPNASQSNEQQSIPYSFSNNYQQNVMNYGQQHQQQPTQNYQQQYSPQAVNTNANNSQIYSSSYNSAINPVSNSTSYMNSSQGSNAAVNITQSAAYVQNHTYVQPSPSPNNSSETTNVPQPVQERKEEVASKPAATAPAVKSQNMDLLSGIDFSAPTIDIPLPTLTPISVAPKKEEELQEPIKESTKKVVEVSVVQATIKMNEDLADLDFSTLAVSTIKPEIKQEVEQPQKVKDPFEDVNVLKQFHKEVESLEKYMETLTVKTLNGITPLANKWKELQDLLVKDESKRSISVAKLFPDKNRYNDFLPYDHGRVLLPTATDNYINAVFIKNCGAVPFIMAQTPMDNTLSDWWEMVWSQKSNILVCLHSSSELLDPFWPQNVNEEKSYGEISVVMLQQFELSHCVENQLKVTRHGSETTMRISLLQIKNWKKKSADHVVDISNNIISSIRQMNPTERQYAPVILNCISGGTERSGLITLGVSAIFATQMRKPILLNVVDHWFRVCSQRKGVLEDESYLQMSLQIVLNNAHRILNKRGIMTSYQVKNAENLNSPIETERTVRDSLQELDPFWKFK